MLKIRVCPGDSGAVGVYGDGQKHKPRVRSIEQDSSDEDESDMFVAVIESDAERKDWKATMRLNRYRTTFKLDTGAQRNISRKTYHQISKRPLLKYKTKLVTFRGHKMKACGKASIECEHKTEVHCG